MKGIFRRRRPETPFLAPLGAAGSGSRLPAAAAPLAVTVIGGIALVAVLGMLLGGKDAHRAEPPAPAAQDQALAVPAPPAEEEPAETAADLAALRQVPEREPEQEPDPARTASILPAMSGAGSLLPSVPVAETEEEIAALEEAQRRAVAADIGTPQPQEAAAPLVAVPLADRPAMRPATANRHVNMRARPDDDAEVLTVVPARAQIEAEDDCGWCEVVYQGRSGYIYKSFIRYAD